jgi:hypothetical protein
MTASVFEIFKIGVGPSSSHTMGPMLAAARFAERVAPLEPVRVVVDLYGSLALTGKGHATDRAVMLGLAGMVPETLDAHAAEAVLGRISAQESLPLNGGAEIAFRDYADIQWHQRDRLAYHTNGLRFTAFDAEARRSLRRPSSPPAAASSSRRARWVPMVPTARSVMGWNCPILSARARICWRKPRRRGSACAVWRWRTNWRCTRRARSTSGWTPSRRR